VDTNFLPRLYVTDLRWAVPCFGQGIQSSRLPMSSPFNDFGQA